MYCKPDALLLQQLIYVAGTGITYYRYSSGQIFCDLRRRSGDLRERWLAKRNSKAGSLQITGNSAWSYSDNFEVGRQNANAMQHIGYARARTMGQNSKERIWLPLS